MKREDFEDMRAAFSSKGPNEGRTLAPGTLPNKKVYDQEMGTDFTARQLAILKKETLWGTYGPRGLGPLKYVPISELETAHLENILTNTRIQPPMKRVFLSLLKDRYQDEVTK